MWKNYEDIVLKILEKYKATLNIKMVHGKKKFPGKTGTEWEVDGWAETNDGKKILIESRNHAKNKQCQKEIAAMKFIISDIGFDNGILVSHLGIQEGAKKVAAATGILAFELENKATIDEHGIKILNNYIIGGKVSGKSKVSAKIEFLASDK